MVPPEAVDLQPNCTAAAGTAGSIHLAEAQVAGNRVLVCRFSHPSAYGVLQWGARLDAPYLWEVVEPTLRLAVETL